MRLLANLFFTVTFITLSGTSTPAQAGWREWLEYFLGAEPKLEEAHRRIPRKQPQRVRPTDTSMADNNPTQGPEIFYPHPEALKTDDQDQNHSAQQSHPVEHDWNHGTTQHHVDPAPHYEAPSHDTLPDSGNTDIGGGDNGCSTSLD